MTGSTTPSRIRRIAVVAAILLFVGYSAFWLLAAQSLKTRIIEEAWLHSQAEEVAISWRDLRITGYPFDMIAIFDEPNIAILEGRKWYRWRTPEAWARSSLPWGSDIEVTLIGEQEFELDAGRGERVFLDSDTFRFTLTPRRSTLGYGLREMEGENLLLRIAERTPIAAMESLRLKFHSRPVGGALMISAQMQSHRIALLLEELRDEFPEALGGEIEELAVSLRLERFPDVPPDLRIIEEDEFLAQMQREGSIVKISEMVLDWGVLDFTGAGEFRIDEKRYPEGSLKMRFEAFDALLRGLADERGDLGEIVDILASLGLTRKVGNADAVVLEFSFRDGKAWFGSFPLGKIGRLY